MLRRLVAGCSGPIGFARGPDDVTRPWRGNFSDGGKVSANGRYVAFESLAGNLTLTPPARQTLGNYVNIYLRDLLTGETQLVSVNHAGSQGGQGDSTNPTISPDGRYVAFESDADDLVSGDSNGSTDVFVRDLQTGETKLVSARSDGQSGNASSYNGSMSPDGRYVVFESDATDLTSDDQNELTDVLRRDMQTGTVVRVSAGSEDPSGFGFSSDPSMSDDGQTIAFISSAAFPTLGVTNLSAKVVIRNLGQDKWAVLTNELLVAAAKAQGLGQDIAPDSTPPSLSADGQYVTFKNDSWVFLYDRAAAKVTVVATNAFVVDSADDETGPFITAHGEKVLYAAVPQQQVEIFVWDRATGKSTLVSANARAIRPTATATPNGSAPMASMWSLSVTPPTLFPVWTMEASRFIGGICPPMAFAWWSGAGRRSGRFRRKHRSVHQRGWEYGGF